MKINQNKCPIKNKNLKEVHKMKIILKKKSKVFKLNMIYQII